MNNPGFDREPTACLNLVLHSHLPYVRHPEYKDFLEEDWFFEAVTETYLRVVAMADRLRQDRVPYRMAMSLTPTLLEMLTDPLLLDRYEQRLERLTRLVSMEEERHRGDAQLHRTANFYVDLMEATAHQFHNRCGRNLVATLVELAAEGELELLGSAATHAVLPLLGSDAARRAQVLTARRAYRRHFGYSPKGFWLPECGYEPGLDALLAEAGFTHFFLESTSLLLGHPEPAHGTRLPVRTPGGCHAFARDDRVAHKVWGAREGYPGHPTYREFYRDLAFDAEIKYLKPYLHGDKMRRPLGIKYHRITGLVPLYAKKLWDPDKAREQARLHARDFVRMLLDRVGAEGRPGGRPPLITATFDAELFGHWWFEGPWFVEALFREMAEREWELRPVTPSEWIARYGAEEVVEPETATWGTGSSYSTWLNPDNAWIWRHLHSAEEELARTIAERPDNLGPCRRVLDQALRELLLAQSSDWPFIMTKRTQVSYAVKRFREHIHCLRVLLDEVRKGLVDSPRLAEIESRHPFLAGVDYRDFA